MLHCLIYSSATSRVLGVAPFSTLACSMKSLVLHDAMNFAAAVCNRLSFSVCGSLIATSSSSFQDKYLSRSHVVCWSMLLSSGNLRRCLKNSPTIPTSLSDSVYTAIARRTVWGERLQLFARCCARRSARFFEARSRRAASTSGPS